MYYLVLPLIALFAVIYLYYKTKVYFDDGIDYESSVATEILYKHIHNEVITENKNPDFNYFQFNNISIPTLYGEKTIESLLISPQGLFVFKPLHFDYKVTQTEIGFSLQNDNNTQSKVDISTTPDQEIVTFLRGNFRQIENLPIHYLTVFTSHLDSPFNNDGLITLDQVKYNIESKMETLSARDIQFIIGQLIVLDQSPIKAQDSFAA